jgi:demethylphylloquinone reductase
MAADIVILGGGFGGLYTALQLSARSWGSGPRPHVHLVDQQRNFVFLPLLYDLLTQEVQPWEIAPDYRSLLLDQEVTFHQAPVESIDLAQRMVQLKGDRPLPFDRLVLALGSEPPVARIPGAAEHALTFHRLADVDRLEQRLAALPSGTTVRVAIVGAGYSGVELACTLADRLGDRAQIRLIEQGTDILRTALEFNRQAARKALTARRIQLDLNSGVSRVESTSIDLDRQGQIETLTTDIVLWTVGNQPSRLVAPLPLPRDNRQQLLVWPTLQVQNHPEIFAVGDVAAMVDAQQRPVPATAQSALQAAEVVARNLWASLNGRSPDPFHYQALGEMLKLGRNHATLASTSLTLEGAIAAKLRRIIYLSRLPSTRQQVKVGLNWLLQPLERS